MKIRKQIRRALFLWMVEAVFYAQFIGLSIINNMGEFEKQPLGCILITAIGLTAVFSVEYLLVRAVCRKLRGGRAEVSVEDELYELLSELEEE